MGNWPEGPGGAQYIISNGIPQVALYGLSVDTTKFHTSGNYYYVAD